jgi:ATP-dependent RNA helicase DeaD
MGDAVEQDGRDVPGTGVTRSQNVLYVMPHDWASISQFLAPILQRVDESSPDLQAIVITSDAELAAAAAAAAVKVVDGRDVNVIAATNPKRAARLIKSRPAQVVTGAPDSLVELMRAAAVKVDTVRAICIAWADEIVAKEALPALETLMSELPKDAARTIVAAEFVPAVDELIERYARRARRVVPTAAQEGEAIALDYVTVSPGARLDMLRRVLDDVDPRSALIFARENEVEVRALLRALGYEAPDSQVVIGNAAGPGTDLVILFDLPASRGELREVCGAATRTIAFIRPRQLPSLRALADGGVVRPVTLSDAGARARDRDAKLRGELREVLNRGEFLRDLLALEPLLDEFDGVEIAAAAVYLLDAARATPVSAAAAASQPRERPAARQAEPSTGPMTRVFVNIGARDGARPADLLGAFANEGGIESSDVGRIDIRESHSIVEVAPGAADSVIERVTGTPIRGRRAIVRRDEERPRGGSGDRPPRESRDRPPRDRGERGERSMRGDRGDRGDRPPRDRGDRPVRDRGDRPTRDRGDRPTRDRGARPPRSEWSSRSERPRRGNREDRE